MGLRFCWRQLTDAVPEMDWLRIMYAYPGYVTDRLIEVMSTRRQVLPYLDMPLQHAHPKTLYRMKRPSNIEWVHRTLGKDARFHSQSRDSHDVHCGVSR